MTTFEVVIICLGQLAAFLLGAAVYHFASRKKPATVEPILRAPNGGEFEVEATKILTRKQRET